MTIPEFIREQNLIDSIKLAMDPIQLVAKNDDLPYDEIMIIDNQYQKIVFDREENPIPIIELLGYTAMDIERINNPTLTEVWTVYHEDINIQDFDPTLIQVSQAYVKNKMKKKEQLSV